MIKDNKLWLGATSFNTGLYFFVPDGFKYAASYKFDRERGGKAVNRVPGVCWFTNLDHGRRHQPLILMTEADNVRYSRHKEIRGVGYAHYDNYDAIAVPYVDAIPSDYDGAMGVPITFLDKYCPEQFEILGITDRQNTSNMRTKKYTEKDTPKYNDLNARSVIKVGDEYVAVYARILIRRLK